MASATSGKYIPPQLRFSRAESLRMKPSRGIEHFIDTLEKDLSEKNIFNLESYFRENPDEDDNFNLNYYLSCRGFIINVLQTIGKELDDNAGNIIQIYPFENNTEEDNNELELLKQKYKKLYLEGLESKNHQQSISSFPNNVYPNYITDLLNQNNKTYEEIERELGIKQIIEQNDEEFLETMKLRIKGLEKCNANREGQYPESFEYLQLEKEIELRNLAELKNKGLLPKDKIREQCKIIHYSWDNFEKARKILNDTEYQKEVKKMLSDFFNEEPNEIEFARTFLPPEYFYYDVANPNKLEIKIDGEDGLMNNLLLKNDRTYRQFVFSYSSIKLFQRIRAIKPFLFEAGGMLIAINRKISCDYLVNWCLLLNLFYCRCALANSNIDFPVRFIIPFTDKSLVRTGINISGNKYNDVQIRDKAALNKIFSRISKNLDSDKQDKFAAEFKGILAIKYYHEQTKAYRVWLIYLFTPLHI